MICPFCKETILDGALKCRYCGSMLHSSPAGTGNITSEELGTFVGDNSQYYLRNFSKFNITGTEKFCPTWNWSCFGFTFIWMLYRKMYVQSLLTFLVFCIPGINILLHIFTGVVGNYLYYRHAKDKIQEIRSVQSAQNINRVLQEVGGVHHWVITTGIVFGILLGLLVFFFFAAISAYVGHHITEITI